MAESQKVYTFDEGIELHESARPIQYTINSENGCWEVYGRDPHLLGYYRVRRNGKLIWMHRYVYELTYGVIPEGYVVRHRCDNPACINPGHLELGTQTDNMQDRNKRGRQAKGEKNGHAKLTTEQVIQIFLSTEPQKVLAERHGVTIDTISSIQNRKIWRHVTEGLTPPERSRHQKHYHRLDAETVKTIFLAEGKCIEIAQRFGVSPTTVSRIKNGQIYTHITAPLQNHRK